MCCHSCGRRWRLWNCVSDHSTKKSSEKTECCKLNNLPSERSLSCSLGCVLQILARHFAQEPFARASPGAIIISSHTLPPLRSSQSSNFTAPLSIGGTFLQAFQPPASILSSCIGICTSADVSSRPPEAAAWLQPHEVCYSEALSRDCRAYNQGGIELSGKGRTEGSEEMKRVMVVAAVSVDEEVACRGEGSCDVGPGASTR